MHKGKQICDAGNRKNCWRMSLKYKYRRDKYEGTFLGKKGNIRVADLFPLKNNDVGKKG